GKLEERPRPEQQPADRMTWQSEREQESDPRIHEQAHDDEVERPEELEQHEVEGDRTHGDEHWDEREETHERVRTDLRHDTTICHPRPRIVTTLAQRRGRPSGVPKLAPDVACSPPRAQ